MTEMDAIAVEISRVDRQIADIRRTIDRAMGELRTLYRALMDGLPEAKSPARPQGDCKTLFRRIAAKTHQDKLSGSNVAEMTGIFVFAKAAYRDGDFETLTLIKQALDSGTPQRLLYLQAVDTLKRKNRELSTLLTSADYSISLEYLSGDPARRSNAHRMFCALVATLKSSR